MAGPDPGALEVPEDLWPPRRNPLRKAGLVVLMIALGVAPGLALMATDPLGNQSEVPPEAPRPTGGAAAERSPSDNPLAEAPAPEGPLDPEAFPESPPPAAESPIVDEEPLVDLEWPEDEAGEQADGGDEPEPVERWDPTDAGNEPVESWTPTGSPEAEGHEGDDDAENGLEDSGREKPGKAERRCLLICLG